MKLERIRRYPVKGFAGQDMDAVALTPGQGLPYDRHLAIVSGNRPDIPVVGGWVPSRTFIQNTIFDNLLTFDCRFDAEHDQLELARADGQMVRVTLSDMAELQAANEILETWFQGGSHGAVRLVEQSPERGFWDYTDSTLSIINLQSIRSLEQSASQALDPVRFRGNLYLEGVPAWDEFSWIGKTIQIGETNLEIIRPILRCSATSVDPLSGVRDFNVPGLMQQQFGHAFCGVYARVASAGGIRAGDTVDVDRRQIAHIAVQPDIAPEQTKWPTIVAARMEKIEGLTRPFLRIPRSGSDGSGVRNDKLKIRVHNLPGGARFWASFGAQAFHRDDGVGWALMSGADDTLDAVSGLIKDGNHLLATGPF